MKHKLIFTGLLLIGLSLFIITLRNTGYTEIFSTLKNFSLTGFIVYISLSLCNFSLFTYRWYIILRVFTKNSSFKDLFCYRLTGYAVSYLTPAAQIGGEPARIYFLKTKDIPLKTGISSVFIDKSLEICASLLFIIVGSLLSIFIGINLSETGIGVASIILVSIIIYVFISIKHEFGIITTILKILRLNKITYIKKNFEKIELMEHKIMHFLKNHPKILLASIGLSFSNQFFIILENFVILKFLGFSPTIIQVFLISTIPNLAYLIPTPAALGALEGGFAVIFNLINITNISAIAYVFIIRLRDLFLVSLGTIYGITHGFKIWKKN